MNSLQIDQSAPADTGGLPFTINAQRNHMRRVFNSWLKRPTDQACHQALHNVMVDYELGARLRALFPLQINVISA